MKTHDQSSFKPSNARYPRTYPHNIRPGVNPLPHSYIQFSFYSLPQVWLCPTLHSPSLASLQSPRSPPPPPPLPSSSPPSPLPSPLSHRPRYPYPKNSEQDSGYTHLIPPHPHKPFPSIPPSSTPFPLFLPSLLPSLRPLSIFLSLSLSPSSLPLPPQSKPAKPEITIIEERISSKTQK